MCCDVTPVIDHDATHRMIQNFNVGLHTQKFSTPFQYRHHLGPNRNCNGNSVSLLSEGIALGHNKIINHAIVGRTKGCVC